jgi:2-haloacid dehalogenase
MEKRYDVILWDVDGTLLNFLESERFALTDCLKHFGLPCREEILTTYSAINDRCWKMLERGEVEKSWVLRHRFEELFTYLGVSDVDVSAFQKRYQYKLGSVFYFQDDAKSLLEKLRTDFQQYIVTNGVEDTQRRKLALSGISDLVEDVFVSECIGYEKPNVGFFEGCVGLIAEKQGKAVEKSRMLIVGDSLTSDMKGGNQYGIDCCYYHREGRPEQIKQMPVWIDGIKIDYWIDNLWEVEQILWQNPQTRN